MKNISLVLVLSIFFSCEKDIKTISSIRDSQKEKIIQNQQDTIIKNISKNCVDIKKNNIYDYYLCKEWKILNEIEIRKILKSGELIDYNDSALALHYTTTESIVWITADMFINGNKYKLKINSGSYFYITDNRNVTSLYLNKNNKYRSLFLSGIGIEDDQLYQKLQIENWNKIKLINKNLNSWKGVYSFNNGNFEQSYQSYHIKIENNACVFYQGDLPACEIDCIVDIDGSDVFLYIKSDYFKKSNYDISLVKSLSEGDFLLKMVKYKNKVYVQSPIIKYWNDKNKIFEKNIQI